MILLVDKCIILYDYNYKNIMKKVSVIVTTKNEAKNIGRCLQSIQNQTYKAIEIIVVDNFSKDETKRIAKKFTKKVFDKGPERSAQRNLGRLS